MHIAFVVQSGGAMVAIVSGILAGGLLCAAKQLQRAQAKVRSLPTIAVPLACFGVSRSLLVLGGGVHSCTPSTLHFLVCILKAFISRALATVIRCIP